MSINQTGTTQRRSSLQKDLLFGSLAVMTTKNKFVILDP